jgi:hypothetical protein
MVKITIFDKEELMLKHPGFHCSLSKQVIWGTLTFMCCYDSGLQEIIYDEVGDNLICDSYEVRIDLKHLDEFGFPKVYEESNIIVEFAESKKIDLADFHMNENDFNSCCLGIFPEYRFSTVELFVQEKVIPFFYWQSYRRLNKVEPWKGYSHGKDGYKEKICDLDKDIKKLRNKMLFASRNAAKNRSRNKLCPCGSKLKYKKCCFSLDKAVSSKILVLENAKRIVQRKLKSK